MEDAFRGPVKFTTRGAEGTVMVRMDQVQRVGHLAKEVGYDVGKLLEVLGSVAYRPGGEFVEEFRDAIKEHVGEEVVTGLQEGFRVR